MNKKWYTIKNAAGAKADEADIYIFDYIGGWDISARSFIDQLQQIDAGKINVHINSPGGSVFDGIAIQNSLKHHKASITIHIDGLAASIASVIALAGDEILIADNAYVMIHNPSSMVWGEASDMLKEAELLEKIADGIAGDYARQMEIPLKEARALMDEETWWLGSEAVEAGFATSTFEGTRAAAHFDVSRLSAKAPEEVVKRFAQSPPPSGITHKEGAMTPEEKKAKAEAEKKAKAEAEAKAKADAAVEPETTDADVKQAVQAALKTERTRTAEITEIGAKFGFEAEARTAIENGKAIEDFRKEILNKSPEDWKSAMEVKNPSSQQTESDIGNESKGADAVQAIKDRRSKKYTA